MNPSNVRRHLGHGEQWIKCFEPCAFDDLTCDHTGCDNIHTHANRIKALTQHLWPVACDEHAT